MKKLLIAIIILLLAIIFILLYCNCRKKCPDGNGKPQTGFCKTGDCNDYNGEPMHGMLNYILAKRMSDDYGNDMGKKYVWNNDLRIDTSIDSRSIWFDYKKMKQFIGYIEQNLCRNGCYDTLSLGIRFYYAKYPSPNQMSEYSDLDGVPREYGTRHTLFMVPTFWDATRHLNIDFDPGQIRYKCLIVPIDTVVGSVPGRVWGAALRSVDGGEDAQNHGSLRPPPADAGGFGDN